MDHGKGTGELWLHTVWEFTGGGQMNRDAWPHVWTVGVSSPFAQFPYGRSRSQDHPVHHGGPDSSERVCGGLSKEDITEWNENDGK
jgi:hypothetical protein